MRTRISTLLPVLLLGAALAACSDVAVTNPNARTLETYWASATDAIQGVNTAYNGLEQNGVYGRWLGFPTDIRADDGKSNSPWTDLANWNKFSFNAYDFEPNHAIWFDHYATIFRANQVIARVPDIDMDPTLRARIVGEAKFIRGLLYYNLINLYGGANLPLQTGVSVVDSMPPTPGAEAVWRAGRAGLHRRDGRAAGLVQRRGRGPGDERSRAGHAGQGADDAAEVAAGRGRPGAADRLRPLPAAPGLLDALPVRGEQLAGGPLRSAVRQPRRALAGRARAEHRASSSVRAARRGATASRRPGSSPSS